MENTNLETQNQNLEGQTTETQQQEGQVKMYTEAEMQQYADRRVTQAMKTAEQKQLKKEREAEKLSRMNEHEKLEYQLQLREEAIAEKEKALALMENKAEASKILAEKGLSTELVDFIVAEDAETMNNNIKILSQAFDRSVKAEIEKRLASKAPRQNLPLDKPIGQAEFRKMGAVQLAMLQRDNPELYEQLSKH